MDFAFHANALAAGAVIERGQVIANTPSIGSVVLATAGGEGRTAVSNYFSEELELANAETRVAGRRFVVRDPRSGKEETRFTTWTSVLMKGVSIFGRVNVGEMGLSLSSTRGFEDSDDHDFDIVIWFRDVRVDGKKLEIGIDEALMRMRRYDDLRAFVKEKKAAASLAKRHDAAGDELAAAVGNRKPVRVSLVHSIRGWEAESLATIHVRGLGTFRFGELMLKPGQRRINLIRATFGGDRANVQEAVQVPTSKRRSAAAARMETPEEAPSPDGPTGGSMTLGSGEGNGIPIGP
jgi:hypothetical protein